MMNWSIAMQCLSDMYNSGSDFTVVISCHLLPTITLINTTDVTCGEEAVNHSGAPEFVPGVRCVRVAYF